ncbi:MAG: hypothetical protein ABIT37_00500 [Luteolibacter sp.]
MEDNPHKLAPNPTHAWLRVTLWILPTGFALISISLVEWLEQRISYDTASQWVPATWIILNCVFTVGAGWFSTVLSPDGLKNGKLRINRVVEFFLIQCLVVPCLSVVVVIVIAALYPNLF